MQYDTSSTVHDKSTRHSVCLPGSELVFFVQMPLRLLVGFLEGAVRLAVEQGRNAAVVKNLRRSENLQVREALTQSKQRYTVTRH